MVITIELYFICYDVNKLKSSRKQNYCVSFGDFKLSKLDTLMEKGTQREIPMMSA